MFVESVVQEMPRNYFGRDAFIFTHACIAARSIYSFRRRLISTDVVAAAEGPYQLMRLAAVVAACICPMEPRGRHYQEPIVHPMTFDKVRST
jgi:hypothetical protein